MLETLHAEGFLDAGEEISVTLRGRQFAHQPGTGILPFPGRKPAQILQAQAFSDLVIDAAPRIVETRVGGVDGDPGSERPDDAALLVGAVGDLPEGLEEERMVRNNHVILLRNRLFYNLFRNIQTDQYASDFRLRESDLQTRVVPLVLQPQRSETLQRGDDFAQFHPCASS